MLAPGHRSSSTRSAGPRPWKLASDWKRVVQQWPSSAEACRLCSLPSLGFGLTVLCPPPASRPAPPPPRSHLPSALPGTSCQSGTFLWSPWVIPRAPGRLRSLFSTSYQVSFPVPPAFPLPASAFPASFLPGQVSTKPRAKCQLVQNQSLLPAMLWHLSPAGCIREH